MPPFLARTAAMLLPGLMYLVPAAVSQRAGPDASVELSADLLRQMEAEIQAGKFKSITSVVIARRGTPAYEYYSGKDGADALRNTRSATKTITGMLIGADIDRHLIPNAQAHVLEYLQDKLPWQNPDPRKSQITI